MATKKTPQAETEEIKAPETEEAVAPATEETDPWKEMVSIFVPRARKGEEETAYVCVNDRRFSIPKNGKTQEMPRPIAEILQESFNAQAIAEEYADNIANRDPMKGTN